MLAATGPPSDNDIATFNIVLFSSLALFFTFYFSVMALVNMEYDPDPMHEVQKAKGD